MFCSQKYVLADFQMPPIHLCYCYYCFVGEGWEITHIHIFNFKGFEWPVCTSFFWKSEQLQWTFESCLRYKVWYALYWELSRKKNWLYQGKFEGVTQRTMTIFQWGFEFIFHYQEQTLPHFYMGHSFDSWESFSKEVYDMGSAVQRNEVQDFHRLPQASPSTVSQRISHGFPGGQEQVSMGGVGVKSCLHWGNRLLLFF